MPDQFLFHVVAHPDLAPEPPAPQHPPPNQSQYNRPNLPVRGPLKLRLVVHPHPTLIQGLALGGGNGRQRLVQNPHQSGPILPDRPAQIAPVRRHPLQPDLAILDSPQVMPGHQDPADEGIHLAPHHMIQSLLRGLERDQVEIRILLFQKTPCPMPLHDTDPLPLQILQRPPTGPVSTGIDPDRNRKIGIGKFQETFIIPGPNQGRKKVQTPLLPPLDLLQPVSLLADLKAHSQLRLQNPQVLGRNPLRHSRTVQKLDRRPVRIVRHAQNRLHLDPLFFFLPKFDRTVSAHTGCPGIPLQQEGQKPEPPTRLSLSPPPPHAIRLSHDPCETGRF